MVVAGSDALFVELRLECGSFWVANGYDHENPSHVYR